MRTRLATVEEEREAFYRVVGVMLANTPRLALNKSEASESLGVSVDFFDEYVGPEVRSVRRGRRQLYPVGELVYWLWRAAE